MAVLRPCADSRRLPTVLAPALPALVLLAMTIAATVDPPAGGPQPQLTRVGAPVAGPVAR